MKVIKKQGKIVKAYKLGERNPLIEQFIQEGKIKEKGKGIYEIFSKEAVNGKGEIAYNGDYIRVDSDGFPYPNASDFVEKHLRHISGNDYEQIPTVMYAWERTEGMCPEIEFLITHKGLIIDETSRKKYFSALLWNTVLSAGMDAVIVFYDIEYDKDGNMIDADFNFVERAEFEKTYNVLV